MKRLFFAIFLLLSIAAFAESVVVGPQTMSSTVERPVTNVGDSWSYKTRDGRTGLVLSENTRMVTQVANNQNIILSKNVSGAVANIIETADMNTISQDTTRFTPNTGHFVFPLTVGKTWVAKTEYETPNYRGSQELNVTVVGYEEVKVLAGTFPAFKIILKGYYNSNVGTGSIDIVRWYAPSVRRIVKEEYKDTYVGGTKINSWYLIELTAYKLAPD